MDDEILEKLNQHFAKCDVRKYKKGHILIMANEEPAGIFFLEEGVVEQYDITPEGNKITVNMYKPPAFFPMSWAINKTPNTYFFEALTDVTLRQEDSAQTLLFVQSNPDVLYNLLGRVYKGTDALLRRIVLAASGVAVNRLIFELLIEAYRFGDDAADSKKLIKITQHALAARSGLARETVSRQLQKLEDDELIERTKEGIAFEISALEQKLDLNV